MDRVRTIDSYVHQHTAEWLRLEELVEIAQKRSRQLTGEELDELLFRYQRVSAQLSHVRSTFEDPQVTARLTRVVAGARAVVYGEQARSGGAIRTFFSSTFPAAVWTARRFILVSALAFFVPALIVGVWLANSPAAIEAVGPEALREAYINEEFEQYYSSAPAAEFSTQVLVNNIQVSFLAFVSGIAWGVPTLLVLIFNGANVGIPAGLFHDAGQAGRFWGLILPHGLLEITAILVAGGAGLRMGWSLIVTGDRSRMDSLVAEAQRAVSVIIGLVIVFVLAGLIEGFVTPSPLDTWARVAIGASAFIAFWAYVIGLGPSAVRRGFTGSITQDAKLHDELSTAAVLSTNPTRAKSADVTESNGV